MFLLLVDPPSTIFIDTFAIVRVVVAFVVLGGVLWVVRKAIRNINRS